MNFGGKTENAIAAEVHTVKLNGGYIRPLAVR